MKEKDHTTSGSLTFAASVYGKEKEYWLDKLAGDLVKSSFPYDFSTTSLDKSAVKNITPENKNFEAEEIHFNPAFLERLMKISKKSDYTLHMLLAAGLTALLGKYSGNDNIIIGTPIYKQEQEGDFLNTVLVLRNQLQQDMNFKGLLLQVRQAVIEANEHQNYPIETLLYNLGMTDEGDDFPLFDVVLLLENIHKKEYIQHTRPNVIFSFSRNDNSLHGHLEYNSHCYFKETIDRIATHYVHILEEALFNLDTPLSGLNILSGTENRQLLFDFNATEREYPADKSIDILFREQVQKSPHAIAVVSEDEMLTFRLLDERSQSLASYIQYRGVEEGDVVGIMATGLPGTLIGVLAILKAGGAYLPLNPEYPIDRKSYLLKDGNVKILLQDDDEPFPDAETINLNNRDLFPKKGEIRRTPMPGDLAYIIYTSGTTGKPKGVMVEHRSVVRLVKNTNFIQLEESDRLLQTGALDFDASTFEIWGCLLNGASLYLVDKETILTPGSLKETVWKNGITVMWMTVALFNQMVDENVEIFAVLRYILVGGDVLSPVHINRVRHKFQNLKVINGYGPTENTTFSVTHAVEQDYDLRIPIGKPIANSTAYILDKYRQPVPIGALGELYVGGDGLARGYMNNPMLTSEIFMPFEHTGSLAMTSSASSTPVSSHQAASSYIYKTGDLARWLPDGNIEFLGRVDYQVKIRGYRVEPGEIENRLSTIDFIHEAVVMVREMEGEKYLCAYVVAADESPIDIVGLRILLGETLPDYMIPAYFVQLDRIPLTPNGKCDRASLPEPEIKAGANYIAPRDEVERKLAGIWAKVLDVNPEHISVDDDFFTLGGHSLKATILVSNIHKECNVKIPLAEIFKKPTIRSLSGVIKGLSKTTFQAIEKAELKHFYSLSPAQKRMFILQQIGTDTTTYNVPEAVLTEGQLDTEMLERAFQGLVSRHESFRTSFELLDGQPVQRVHDSVHFAVQYYESSEDNEPGKRPADIIGGFVRPFDLGVPPLIRVGVIKIDNARHILLFDIHHIITDGTSMNIVIAELMDLYAGKELPPLRIQYKDFSEWQNTSTHGEKLEKAEAYWLSQFEDDIPAIHLPLDFTRSAEHDFRGELLYFEINREETKALNALALREGATLYMVLLALYNVFLSKISNQEDIVVGTVTAGRRHADLEQVVGMFVNTLAIRSNPNSGLTFTSFLNHTKDQVIDAFNNQDYPFEDLVDILNIKRDVNRNPLFDVGFSYHNEGESEEIPEMEIPGIKLSPYLFENHTSKFDLTLIGSESGDKLTFSFEYGTALFKQDTIRRLIRYFQSVVSSVIHNPVGKLADITIISEQERKEILFNFNDTRRHYQYPKDLTIHQLFEEQAERNPGLVAVMDPQARISYKELDEKANCLAVRLCAQGLQVEEPVAILADHSIEMIIGILAILKAGGAYLPINRDYPSERKRYLLQDAGARILLTDGDIDENFDTVLIHLGDPRVYEGNVENGLGSINQPGPRSLAYIIYTSGSTGIPKGVMVEHRNVVRLVKNTNYVEFITGDSILQTGALEFDASTFEIWGALLNGLELYLVEKEVLLNPSKLKEALEKYSISTIWLTSTLFNQVLSADVEIFAPLKNLLVGGDVLSPGHIGRLLEKYPHLNVINGYGPTENTTFSTTFLIRGESMSEYRDNIPIGKPIANSNAYVVDKNGQLQPVGIPGELWVGADGVSRGYLNNPELTEERFLDSPFEANQRVYRTGDLARWMHDGTIQFLGRMDYQVKIRGFRIEPGEIENRLTALDDIAEAVVTIGENNGEKYLCAYLVSTGGVQLNMVEVRNSLSRQLPDYMIPAHLIQIEQIPLTPNGKCDRKALPKPGITGGTDYVAPGDAIEAQLVSIWADVLGIDCERISVEEDFFALGGHSLNATVLISHVHKQMDVKLPLVEIFKNPTVRELAGLIKGKTKNLFQSIEVAEVKTFYQLSAAQRRMFILQQMEKEMTTYNVPLAVILEGELDKEALEKSFQKLIRRHESFRTSFELQDDLQVQIIHDIVDFGIQYIDCRETGEEEVIAGFVRPFNLSSAPLLRVGLLHLSERKYLLFVDLHHIITDGTSMSIILKELMALYMGEELPPLRIQYKDFSEWQNTSVYWEEMKREEAYWLDQFKDGIPVLHLPLDSPRPTVQDFSGDIVYFEINQEETKALNALAFRENATLYMLLLAIFNIFLSKISSQEDIVVGTVTAGRRHADLGEIVGMFINTLAIRNHPKKELRFTAFLHQVKNKVLDAFTHQDYPFENLVEKLEVERNAGRNPLFDVGFSLHNEGEYDKLPEMEIPGLTIHPYPFKTPTSKFDLTLNGYEQEGKLCLSFEYSTVLFRVESIRRLTRYFGQVISDVIDIIDVPDADLAEIEIISPEERKKILETFNDTRERFQYPKDKCIHQLFKEQAARRPGQTAVVDPWRQISYKELDEASGSLAAYLCARGIRPEEPVGIMVEHSVEMVIGILGILKAGGAYLPINSSYPEDRKRYLIEDAGANILLTDHEVPENYGKELIQLKNRDFYHSKAQEQPAPVGKTLETAPKDVHGNGRDRKPTVDPMLSRSLAYIIYTSGSTGTPKGVMVEHRNVVRLVQNTNFVEFDPGDSILQTGALEFDASTFEIWGALLNGLKLYLVDKETLLTPELLKQALLKYNISTIWMTASLFNQMLQADIGIFSGLKNLLVGGDVLSPPHINRLLARYPDLNVINGYGPTENTTFSTTFLIKREYAGSIPIGQPIANSTAYIVDNSGYLQPIGIPGELWVGGDGIGRGYLNNPQLSRERFLLSPFNEGERLYRTGDRVRWLPDGNIEFLGRMDFQIKIRGYRVEPGEIESRLKELNGVDDAVLVIKEKESEKYLCAYVVLSQFEPLDVERVKDMLSEKLPDYMVPAYVVPIDKIPLTPNGKCDRDALPVPEMKRAADYVPPADDVEKTLVGIWAKLLGHAKETLSVEDDFFQLGGHSIKATILISNIHKVLDVKIPLADIFQNPTIRELAGIIKGLAKNTFTSIQRSEIKEYYPLSAAQKRMFILQQMGPQVTAYNVPLVIRLKGEVDRGKLENAFNGLILRHEVFRTSFQLQDDTPYQRIHESVNFSIQTIDTVEDQPTDRLVEHFIRPFNLAKAPLLRAGLMQLETDEHLLLIDMHHIITDGTSMRIIFKELTALYTGEELPLLQLQYKDFSQWQNSPGYRDELAKAEAYWLKQLGGELPALDLPLDYPRPVVQDFEGADLYFEIGKEETRALEVFALKNDVTLFMLLLAVYNILLAKLSNQEDIIVGTVMAGRRHSDLEQMIGMFVNTLALRNYPQGQLTVSSFLQQVKEGVVESFNNQDYPFEDLVEKLEIKRDVSRNPLFDVGFSFHNNEEQGELLELELPGLKLAPYENANHVSKFDITLVAFKQDDALKCCFEYSTTLFKQETIQRLTGYFHQAVSSVLKKATGTLAMVDIINFEEKKRLLIDFNDTMAKYPKDKTIHRLFEEQASETPDQIALIGPSVEAGDFYHQVSYRELNKRSQQLASLLMKKGVKPGTLVGIMAKRSVELIVGILGILKAGGAYMPIDPEYPEKRIDYMMKDSATGILLTNKRGETGNDGLDGEVETIDLTGIPATFPAHDTLPVEPVGSADPAYVIYTSGSTGKPKGTLVAHHSVVNLVISQKKHLPIKSADRILQFSTISFDASVEQIYMALFSGAALVLVEMNTLLDNDKFETFVLRYGITFLNVVPSFLSNIRLPENHQLKWLIMGGDICPPALARKWSPQCDFYNQYGPTETTVTSLVMKAKHMDEAQTYLPIGKPIDNTFVYLLDKWKKPVAEGVVGELYIGGEGVCRGYLNQPELTAEKFIPNPLTDDVTISLPTYPSPIYRTGDLARWLPDGNLQFVGRTDQQVKLRGFRIELGEIERQLLKYETVKEAVVTIREIGDIDQQPYENKNNAICAYIVAHNPLDIVLLKEYLATVLPAYMIPSYFIQLKTLPLAPSGKTNLKALPEPELSTGANVFTAPRTRMEALLVEIWTEVLRLKKGTVDIDSSFFDLGGHSLSGAALTGQIRKKLNVQLHLADLFRFPTVRTLAKHLKKAAKKSFIPIERVEEQEYYELSFNQKRLWIIQKVAPGDNSYNLPGKVEFNEAVDEAAFKRSVEAVIKKHESLRTGFKEVNGKILQYIVDTYDIPFRLTDVSSLKEERKTHDIKKILDEFNFEPFNLDRPPLFRSILMKIDREHYLFAYNIHHIVTDGWSMQILENDFKRFYDAFLEGQIHVDAHEEKETIRYIDFAHWHNHILETSESKDLSRQFWSNLLREGLPPLHIPRDFHNQGDHAEGAMFRFVIPTHVADALKTIGKTNNLTLFTLLFSVYNLFLSMVSGQKTIVSSIVNAGREHPSLSRVVGFFVNSVVYKTQLNSDIPFLTFSKALQESVTQFFKHQNYPLELVLDEVGRQYPQVTNSFNMINFQLGGQLPNLENLDSYHIDETQNTKFDIEFYISEYSNGIEVVVSYNKYMFKAENIKLLMEKFQKTVAFFASAPSRLLKDCKEDKTKKTFKRRK